MDCLAVLRGSATAARSLVSLVTLHRSESAPRNYGSGTHTPRRGSSPRLFERHQQEIYRRTDHLFAGLMTFQWLGGIVAALWISPKTWIGTQNQTHIHVWAAILLGGAITSFRWCLPSCDPEAH